MFKWLRDPISALTHFGFSLLAIPLTIILAIWGFRISLVYMVSFIIFGTSMFLLYLASGLYHGLKLSEKHVKMLKRIDHMMIFVLIAGTYTPVCLILLKGTLGIALLITIWSIAILGVLFKIFFINAPRYISTLLYVLMGWIAVFIIYPLAKTASTAGLFLMISGGVIYTVGAVIYALKLPKLKFQYFGFHEIFHLFVIGGTLCHYAFMFTM